LPVVFDFTAVKVTAEAAPGFSSGEAINAMEETATQILPSDYGIAWSGQTFEEKKAGGSSLLVLIFGLIMVFLILAGQYEKWSLPLGVLSAVPFALFGALLAIFVRGLSNDIYFQIGLTMLIALAAKNAILIFEYAVANRVAGQSVYDAAINAARDRLRPIIMTSLAFTLGCVPLAIATGVSANSKISIGTGVVGGMLGATVIAISAVAVRSDQSLNATNMVAELVLLPPPIRSKPLTTNWWATAGSSAMAARTASAVRVVRASVAPSGRIVAVTTYP
jgi:multidrug efflux pump